MTKAYMTIDVGPARLGTLSLILYEDTVPRTVRNFVALLQREEGSGYLGSTFHRIIKKFMAQGGDFTNGDGTGGESIYGPSFADENFIHSHDARGVLSMANSGPNTNGSQFFITFGPTPHLDGRHVVFGRVDLTKSSHVLDAMEKMSTGRGDAPLVPITISSCGLFQSQPPARARVPSKAATANDDEIDLDEDDEDEQDAKISSCGEPQKMTLDGDQHTVETLPEDDEIDVPEDEEKNTPKAKGQALRDRLRRLKMKNNQGRQLNRQAVMKEGERLGSEEGKAKERKRQALQDKKLRQAEWETRNARALEVAAEAGIDGKYIVEQAEDSIKKTTKKANQAEARRFRIRDYHNPEGQHRNYERNVKSLPAHSSQHQADESTFNPMMAVSSGEREDSGEREGARRLANEMKRRIEKQAEKKRDRLEFEATDVSYINERNKRFNVKISRNFDEHTAEIRQNLERGTAL